MISNMFSSLVGGIKSKPLPCVKICHTSGWDICRIIECHDKRLEVVCRVLKNDVKLGWFVR